MLALLSAIAAEVANETTTTVNPVVPDDLGEIFWGAVGFFGLWILMRYVLLPPLMKVREERDRQVLSDQEAAAGAESQAEQVRRDYDATIGEARAEAARIIEEARTEAEARRSAVIAAAEAEVAEQRQAAMAELDAARAQALGELRGEVSALAVAAASRVVQSELDAGGSQAAVDEYLNQSSGER
jgi:F-type H+-transporting ATPase subunit b